MLYEFQCKKCDLVKEVFRRAADCRDIEECDMCGKQMIRLYSPARFAVFHPYHNHGLGIDINHRRDLKEHLRKTYNETGQEMVEIGNEKQNVEKKAHSYELTREEYQEAERILNTGNG